MSTSLGLHNLELPNVGLRARTVVEGVLSGVHRARMHGSSVEFAEHKEYAPGDDVRHIDWKQHARNDRYYVKQFEQESELTAHIVLDASASMSYGNKLQRAIELSAALAYLLVKQRDRVGLIGFGDPGKDVLIPPRSRPAHLFDLFSVLEQLESQGGNGEETLTAALERLVELTRKRRSLVLVVSDFFDRSGGALSVLSHLRARQHDVAVFHVLHADERELPFRGLTKFEALEGSHFLMTYPGAIRSAYQKKLHAFVHALRSGCTAVGIDYVPASCEARTEDILTTFLAARVGDGIQEAAWAF